MRRAVPAHARHASALLCHGHLLFFHRIFAAAEGDAPQSGEVVAPSPHDLPSRHLPDDDTWAGMHVYVCVCMYVCMYADTYIFVCVCVCVCQLRGRTLVEALAQYVCVCVCVCVCQLRGKTLVEALAQYVCGWVGVFVCVPVAGKDVCMWVGGWVGGCLCLCVCQLRGKTYVCVGG